MYKTDETLDKIKKLEQELEKERENNKQITFQLGQWTGRAKTLEEQNQKLLEIRNNSGQKIGFFRHILDFWKK